MSMVWRRAGVVGGLLAGMAFGVFADEVSYIPAREYAAVAEREIDAAKKSVHLAMYLFTYFGDRDGSDSSRLAQALARAAGRGVGVDVLLNHRVIGGEGAEALHKNRAAAAFLLARGVTVGYSDGPLMHAKTLVVDGKTLLVGSTNWSEAAFDKNGEGNLLARSTAAAQAALREQSAWPRRRLTAPQEDVVPVPAAFLAKDGPLPTLVSGSDDRGFDAYLLLLQASALQKTNDVRIDERSLADRLGFHNKQWATNQGNFRRVLKRLRDRYGLIEFDPQLSKDPVVRLKPFPPGDSVRLPRSYFDWGWDQRLPFAAKVFFLLNLRHSATSPASPRWSLGRQGLLAEHGIKDGLLDDGVTALRRAALLDVEYSTWSRETASRQASTYAPLPLYDPRNLEGAFQALAITHGDPALSRARRIAALVYADADVDAVERLILLEKQHGPALVDSAVATVGAKSPTNPKRSARYLIGTIEGMAGSDQ